MDDFLRYLSAGLRVRDALEIHNQAQGVTISKYEYSNDAIGRRTQRIDTSSSVTTNDFLYNDRSELTNAVMGAEAFDWVFDNIGNRELYTTNGVSYTYLVNELNQYTNIHNGVTNEPTYDLDGNMLTYNGWSYEWSGENRMIQATNVDHVVSYSYDWQGRMFEKVVDGETNSLIWDGYNIIAEIKPGHTNFNVWALDLSGSMQGAGGVGGLVAVVQDGAVYFANADGNGNVTEYTDDTTTNIVAQRTYSAFGRTISLTGDKKDDFTHWWSTKPFCATTDLSEYEWRKYLPEIGRWGSKDPLGERVGVNLYGFVQNNPLSWIDPDGLWPWRSEQEKAVDSYVQEEIVRREALAAARQKAIEEAIRSHLDKCCCSITIIVTLPRGTEGGKLSRKGMAGHVGTGIDGSFWDYGPQFYEGGNILGSEGQPWWDKQTISGGSDASLKNVLAEIDSLRHGRQTYKATIIAEGYQCEQLTDYWKQIYADPGTFHFLGKVCSTVAIAGLVESGVVTSEELHARKPSTALEQIKKLKNTCGAQKGKPVKVEKLR